MRQSLTPWLLLQLPLCICAKIFDASAEAVQVLVQRPKRFLKSPVHAAYLTIDVSPHLHTVTSVCPVFSSAWYWAGAICFGELVTNYKHRKSAEKRNKDS